MNRNIQEAVDIYKRTSDEQVLKSLVRMLEVYASRELIGKQDHIEARSDLNFVIFKAITKYDASKNIKFITFFWHCYHNHINRNYRANQTQKRGFGEPVFSLNKKMSKKIDGEEFGYLIESKKNEVEEFMFQTSFYEILNNLRNSQDIYIIECLYKGFTAKEIAKLIGYSHTYVHQRIRRFRSHSVGQQLHALLKDRIAEKTG
jgi:RNA polymerase sigma factor (sigma-70 family)